MLKNSFATYTADKSTVQNDFRIIPHYYTIILKTTRRSMMAYWFSLRAISVTSYCVTSYCVITILIKDDRIQINTNILYISITWIFIVLLKTTFESNTLFGNNSQSFFTIRRIKKKMHVFNGTNKLLSGFHRLNYW